MVRDDKASNFNGPLDSCLLFFVNQKIKYSNLEYLYI